MKERVYNANMPQKSLLDKTTFKRHWELDFLRGVCVLLMVMDHFFWSADNLLPGIAIDAGASGFWEKLSVFARIYWGSTLRHTAWIVIISLFFLICGISCALTRSNVLRGIKTLAVGLIITLGTYLADSFFNLGVQINFGVIHMLGCSILIFSLIDLVGWGLEFLISLCFKGNKGAFAASWVRKLLPMAVGIAVLIVYFSVPWGSIEMYTPKIVVEAGKKAVEFPPYPELVSHVKANGSWVLLDIFIDFTNINLGGSDYFPLMPYGLLVLIGSGIGQLVYKTKAKRFSDYIILFPLGAIAVFVSSVVWLVKYLINKLAPKSASSSAAAKRPYQSGESFLLPLDGVWNKPIGFVGRRTLIIYMLHQILVVGIFYAACGIYALLT